MLKRLIAERVRLTSIQVGLNNLETLKKKSLYEQLGICFGEVTVKDLLK